MKKIIPILILITILLPTIFALNIDVKKISANEVVILDLNKPATFDIQIKNNGDADNLVFYTYYTVNFSPKETIQINKDETKDITIEVYPPENLKTTGHQTFEYYIRSQKDDSTLTQKLIVNAVKLEDAFEIGASDVNTDAEEMTIYIHSKVNFKFENLKVKFSSPFFNLEDTITLEPNQKKEYTVELDKNDYKKLLAGYYTMTAKVEIENSKAEIETPIRFVEKNILIETSKEYGFLVNTKIITKTNEGNTISNTETVIKKNVFSRLFTTFNSEPDIVDRQGFAVYYTWNQEINPSEEMQIKVKTNWMFPVLIIVLIVLITVLTKYYSSRNLVLRKKVSFVRTKGGEFALRISVVVNAKKYLEKVSITERLPPLVKLHERFGSETPSRIDEKNKRIKWDFEKLEQGETRIISYILYSKIGIIGKFALPRTSAIFERDGKIMERNSNKAYFVIEQDEKRE